MHVKLIDTRRRTKAIERLRKDGWVVLEPNPAVWSIKDISQITALLRKAKAHPPCGAKADDCPACSTFPIVLFSQTAPS